MYLFIATLKVQVQARAEPEPPLKVQVGPVPKPEPRTSGPVWVQTRFEQFANRSVASLSAAVYIEFGITALEQLMHSVVSK